MGYTVAIHVDSPAGVALGTAQVHADGSFCQNFRGPPASLLGNRTIVAVQNSVVQRTIPVQVIRPTVIK